MQTIAFIVAGLLWTAIVVFASWNMGYDKGETSPVSQEAAEASDTVADLIHKADMFAEACSKYGPDDLSDDSCARQKIVEVKLRKDHNMCLDVASMEYRFVPCVSKTKGASNFKVSDPTLRGRPRVVGLSPVDENRQHQYSGAVGHRNAVAELRRLDKLCADDGGGVSGSPNCVAAARIDDALADEGLCADFHNDFALKKCETR